MIPDHYLRETYLTWRVNDLATLHHILSMESFFFKGNDTPVLTHTHRIVNKLAHNEAKSKLSGYKIEDVVYTQNMYGFRGTWKDIWALDQIPNKILVIGCSNTFGEAVANGHEWPAVFAQQLKITHPKYNVINLGMSGSSMQRQIRIATYMLDTMEWDAVIHLLPNFGRKEVFQDKELFKDYKPINIIPAMVGHDLYPTKRRQYELLLSEEFIFHEAVKYLTHLELAAKSTPVFVSSWDPVSYDMLPDVVTTSNVLPKFVWTNTKPQFGFDGSHPGLGPNTDFVNNILPYITPKL